MKTEEQIAFNAVTLTAANEEADVLGNILAEGARLISEGKIPHNVIEEKNGSFALCLIERDSDCVRELHSGDSLTIGRSSTPGSANWPVSDKWLSKAHFTVSVDDNGIPRLEDLASLNGTFLNDRAVSSPTPLIRGSCIRAGHSLFLFL